MIYVTSDLHGYPLEKFSDMLKSVNFSQNDILYILGDVIDRGKDGIKPPSRERPFPRRPR